MIRDIVEQQISGLTGIEQLKEVTAILLRKVMEKEGEMYLRQSTDNKANGFYQRSLACLLGNLNLNVPWDRKSDFRSNFLPPPYVKSDPSFDEVIKKLILNSYSPNRIKTFLNSPNLPYSQTEIEEIKDELYKSAKELNSKALPE